MKTEGYTRVLWLVCWLRKLEIRVHSLLTEDTSKTEDRLYRFCRRGFLFSREEKSDFVSRRCGRMFGAWLTIFRGFEDDGSRKVGSVSVK